MIIIISEKCSEIRFNSYLTDQMDDPDFQMFVATAIAGLFILNIGHCLVFRLLSLKRNSSVYLFHFLHTCIRWMYERNR